MKFGKVARLVGAALMISAVGLAAVAVAADDPITARRAVMKGNGGAAKTIGGFMDGSVPFDAAKAAEAAMSISKGGHEFASNFDALFPDSSKTGDTHANPVIWDNKDDFKAKAAALEADAGAASTAAATGADAFKAAAGKMFGNCKGCHEKYRLAM